MSVSVPPRSLAVAIAHLNSDGRLAVRTYVRTILLTKKTLVAFEKAGSWLIREDGDGYRIRSGKGSLYILPGQLVFY